MCLVHAFLNKKDAASWICLNYSLNFPEPVSHGAPFKCLQMFFCGMSQAIDWDVGTTIYIGMHLHKFYVKVWLIALIMCSYLQSIFSHFISLFSLFYCTHQGVRIPLDWRPQDEVDELLRGLMKPDMSTCT